MYDHVYIDFNAVVHDALSRFPNNTPEQIVQHSMDRLEYLVCCTRPAKLLFVSVDGTAPLAKMQQQRNRRFVHELTQRRHCDGETNNHPQNRDETYLDRAHISPATPFMHHLRRGLQGFSARFSCTCPSVEVVLSTDLESGEGEQKIFRHITASYRDSQSLSVLVHGLDADLILMSLLSPHWNAIELYRETPGGCGGDCILNVRSLRTQLERNINVRDFVVICLLLGNDFIPSLTGLRLKTNGLSILLSMYHSLAGGGHGSNARTSPPPWLSTGGPDVTAGISLSALRSFMSSIAENEHQLAREEDAWYNEQCARTYTQMSKRNGTSSSSTTAYGMLAMHMHGGGERYPLENPESGIVDFVHHAACDVLWRRRYYNALFVGGAAGSAARIREAAMAFVAGLAWTLRYLGDQKLYSVGWTYPYDYAPLALDIQHFLSESTPHIIEELDDHFSTLDRTLEHTCTTDWGYDGSLSSRRVNKTIVYRNKPTGDNELTSVVDDRTLRIGFFHWLLSVIIRQSSPPTESHVRDILTSNRMQLVKWERIVEELLVAKVIRSFVQVVKLLWNNFIEDDVDADRTNFNFVTSVTTLVTYPTSYVMDLLKFRKEMLSYKILNTHIKRVMKLIGRNVQETVSMRSATKSVEGPYSHNVSTLYEIDDPTTQSAYKALMEDRKTNTRNSVVPPFAAIVYKAALLLGTVHAFTKDNPPPSDLPDNSRGPSLPSRKFQSAKNSMLWYLEQVMIMTRVSRTIEATSLSFSDITFFISMKSKDGVIVTSRVPAIVGAFVPEVLSYVKEYLELTWKGKLQNKNVIHIHSTLPGSASMLSFLHAFCFAVRFMFLYDIGFLDPTDNIEQRVFAKRGVEGKFSYWGSSDSNAKGVDPDLCGKDNSPVNDFSPYAARYLAAATLAMLRILHVRKQNKRGVMDVTENLTLGNLANPLDKTRCLDFLRFHQFGHGDTQTIEKVYSSNPNTLKYHTGTGVENIVPIPMDVSHLEDDKRDVVNALVANVRRWHHHFPGNYVDPVNTHELATGELPEEVADKVTAVIAHLDVILDTTISGGNLSVETSLKFLHDLIKPKDCIAYDGGQRKQTVAESMSVLSPMLDLRHVFIETSMLPSNWKLGFKNAVYKVYDIHPSAMKKYGALAFNTVPVRALGDAGPSRERLWNFNANPCEETACDLPDPIHASKRHASKRMTISYTEPKPTCDDDDDDDEIPKPGEVGFAVCSKPSDPYAVRLSDSPDGDVPHRVYAFKVTSIRESNGYFDVQGVYIKSDSACVDGMFEFPKNQRSQPVRYRREDFLMVLLLDDGELKQKRFRLDAEQVAQLKNKAINAIKGVFAIEDGGV
eukprot:gene9866-biopygen7051